MLKLVIGFCASLFCVLLAMPHLINYFKKISFNQTVSEYSLDEYKEKAKTPIMGGVLFIIVPVIISLLLCFDNLFESNLLVVLLVYVGYGLIGFVDDYLIAVKKNNDGLSPRMKFMLQIVLALVFYLMYHNHSSLNINIPIINKEVYLGFAYIFLVLFMFSGSSNAVNLTDGMDGLAAGCTWIALIPFLIFSIKDGNMPIATFICCMLGALIGFLHYNIKPAKIFMGDTGSLSLGGVLAAIAMVLHKELLLAIIGGIFVLETLCVIIQIGSVKLRGKRVFLYTPIHYAFVMKGIKENEVVHWFWLVGILFAVIGVFIG